MDKLDWMIINEIAKTSNISKAAEKLYLSQPAISYRLNRMEKEFTTSLFSRSSSGIHLNSTGLRLQSYANLMLSTYREIEQTVKESALQSSSFIQIGASITFGEKYLPKQIQDFCESNIETMVVIETGISSVICEKLRTGELTMGITRGDCPWEGAKKLLFSEPLIIISSKPINDIALLHSPLLRLSNDTGTGPLIEKWAKDYFGGKLHPVMAGSAGTRSIPSLVAKGFGWTIIPLSRIDSASGLYCHPLRNADGSLCTYPTWFCYTKVADEIEIHRRYKKHFLNFFSNFKYPSLNDYIFSDDEPWINS